VIVSILILQACTKEQPEYYGSIQGCIINGLTQQPEPEILVYLLDRNGTVDTINYDNSGLKLDSIETDLAGCYVFDSLSKGSYSVVPFSKTYSFQHIDSTDSYDFEITEDQSYQIDFQANPNFMSSFFNLKISSINVPEKTHYIVVLNYRRSWIFWIPQLLIYGQDNVYPDGQGHWIYSTNPQYGFSAAGFYTLDNYFQVYVGPFDVNGKRLDNQIVEVFTPIHATPPEIEYQIDWDLGTITRIK